MPYWINNKPMNKPILLILFIIIGLNANAGFVKISERGKLLNNNAKKWSCVLDNRTNLIWEVKSTEEGLQNYENTYTWFDGVSGVKNGKFSRNCYGGEMCNSQNYISKLNKKFICGLYNWRLPTISELKSLIVYKDDEPLIDIRLFPNTKSKTYWSSSTSSAISNIALDVPFFYGGTIGSDKSFDSHIRAVHNAE
jgi:hypothetical protein|tara:strand:- start:886 stop:1470 length:585 start_codon:yes stop_codon:yes gene_type:complete